MSRDKDEQELDAYLEGDSELSKTYRRLSNEQPPARVDEAILAASRRAVRSGPGLAYSPFASNWKVPLSLAAVLVLCVTLVVMIQDETGAPSFAKQSGTPMTINGPASGTRWENMAAEVTEISSQNDVEEQQRIPLAKENEVVLVPAQSQQADELFVQGQEKAKTKTESAEKERRRVLKRPDEPRPAKSVPQRLLADEDNNPGFQDRLSTILSADKAGITGGSVETSRLQQKRITDDVQGISVSEPAEEVGIVEQSADVKTVEPVPLSSSKKDMTGGLRAAISVTEGSVTEDKSVSKATAISLFMSHLEGNWAGRAVTTPAGPLPYDIVFGAVTGRDCLTGTADTGNSHHTWTFCPAGDSLKLDFLSDFRGNSRPIHFEQVGYTAGVYSFKAASHDFMEVLVSVNQGQSWFKIYHYGKLHVEIRLRKKES